MHPTDQLDGDVGRARHGHAQGGEVVPRRVRVVEDRLVERRRSGEDRDPFRGDAGQHAIDVEDGLGQHGGAAGDTGEDARLEAEHVEVRVHLEVAVAGLEARHGHPVGRHRQRAAVRHDDTLGDPGGPRGEEDVGGIVRAERPGCAAPPRPGRRSCPRRRSRARPPPFRSRRPWRPPSSASSGSGDSRALEHGHVVGAQEVGDGDEDASPAARQDLRRLGTLEPRVHRDEDRACREQAQRRHDPLDAVAAPDRHPIAGLEPGHHERGAEPPGCHRELGVRERRFAVAHRHPVAELLRRSSEHGRDGGPCDRD